MARTTPAKVVEALVLSKTGAGAGGEEGQDNSSGDSCLHGEGGAPLLFLNILLSEKLWS